MTADQSAAPLAIIAEDEEIGRELLRESALAAGLTPLVFDNGIAALAAALTQDVAIVLLDVEMPGLNGYAVCRRIRETAHLATMPIVMVTGRDDTTAVNDAFDAGATDFISKPVNWALLPHRLAYILRNAASVRALADREAKVSALVDAIPDSLWVVSPAGELRWSPNDRSLSQFASGAAVTAAGLEVTVPPEHLADVLRAIRQTAQDNRPRKIEYQDKRPHASQYSSELRFSRCEAGDVLVVRQDTSERTAAAEHIEQLAYFDPLTGLANRQRCIEVAERLLAEAADTQAGVGFVYLSLNSFKRVNDSFGHSVGDMALNNVAEALSGTLLRFRTSETDVALARLGGDEFVVLIKDRSARARALEVANACCRALEEPIMCGQLEFFAMPSVGVAIYPEDGKDVETLLKHANTAMHQAKSGGIAGVAVYTAAMSARLRDWLELESRLRRAVREDLLDLRFQPKFSLRDNSMTGVEALIRWYDAEHGEIPPSRFISIAEESGLIVDVGAWTIHAACKQLRLWLDRGVAVPIAINVSGKELLYGDPARVLETETSRLEIPTSLIEVEITESVFVTDSIAGSSSVERLRQLGCRIALDDFGTGYSSLAYLTRFPPDRLKIDRSFVHNLEHSASDAAIVDAIMSLARTLNLIVTAEGVERSSQLEWLRARGCHEAQGYLLSRPLSATVLEECYLRNAAGTAPVISTIPTSLKAY
jgi:diguanylate cyclase (GGDEF)-like protein